MGAIINGFLVKGDYFMANRKKGSIAIPFLVTFLIALLIVGGGALYIYKSLDINKESELDELYATEYGTATYEDSHTILFVLNVPEQKCSSTFLLMRSVPKEKKLLLTGIPSNTITIFNEKQASLKEVYENSGINSALDFVQQVSGVEVEKYMIFNNDSFLKLSDIMGGVSYGVTVDIAGFQDTDKEQYLNGKQTISLLTYPMFSGGEVERASMCASVISAMINQADGPNLAKGLERNFNTLINMVESNISSGDFKERQYAVKFMLNYGNSISHFSMIEGTSSEEYFVIDKFFSNSILEEYFADKTDEKEKK